MNKKELINKISEENEQLRRNIELLKQESIRLESDIIKLETVKSDKIQEERERKERKEQRERKERKERKCFRFRNILK